MSKNSVYKPKPVSGFPEWLPAERDIEQQWFDHIRKIFESYGFGSIETPSVEELDVIKAKGGDGEQDVDKEVYVLERLHKQDGDKEARLALHFDQTVPLARYVAQHFNELVFPFKRYQMQRVWRGERPQAGRFREFYQCDIDVINVDNLPLHFDAEMPAIIWETLNSLPGMENENIQIRINNRKIFIGLLHDVLRPEHQNEVLRVLDKREKLEKMKFEEELDKILKKYIKSEVAFKNVKHDLQQLFNFRDKLIGSNLEQQIEQLQEILVGHSSYEEYQDHKQKPDVPVLKTPTTQFYAGLEELISVLKSLTSIKGINVATDFFMVRGLDYYTGTVYETVFTNDPSYGSICSGGRYDDLASAYINKALPGVGISIGFSRLFDRLRQSGALPQGRVSPTQVLVVLQNEEQRSLANETAHMLRQNGYNVEVFHSASKIKKQMAYAEKKGIPYVWFPPFKDGQPHEVKNMSNGEQKPISPENWTADEKALDDVA